MASDLLRGIFFQNFQDGVTQQPVWRATDEDGTSFLRSSWPFRGPTRCYSLGDAFLLEQAKSI